MHSEQIQSPPAISGVIRYFHSLLMYFTPLRKQAALNPHLGKALIQLTSFCRKRSSRLDLVTKCANIRNQCNKCLSFIRYYGNLEIQRQLIRDGLISSMIETISTCGGCQEERIDIIRTALENIINIFIDLHIGKNQSKVQEKIVEEIFEAENGMEEVYSNIFHSNQFKFDSVNSSAFRAKELMIKSYIHISNLVDS
ncbi:MAG: hypothetical protein EZS28_033018 [Streblomastix strix]|uniref:Uncharacterized protein n=1 Tax=Streblomastix strix TaxID=222440 RepID=A0A5J4UNY7_9EUKA|nr:MAG: hypothetical protein EZS28_033018 [Streblomastix strix]